MASSRSTAPRALLSPRLTVLLEQVALGTLIGIVAIDLAYDLPVISNGATNLDLLVRVVTYYKVALGTPHLMTLIGLAAALLLVTRIASLRRSLELGQLMATALLVPVAGIFAFAVLPAEQKLVAAPAVASLTTKQLVQLLPSLLMIAWGHLALAVALVGASVLTMSSPIPTPAISMAVPASRASAPPKRD